MKTSWQGRQNLGDNVLKSQMQPQDPAASQPVTLLTCSESEFSFSLNTQTGHGRMCWQPYATVEAKNKNMGGVVSTWEMKFYSSF